MRIASMVALTALAALGTACGGDDTSEPAEPKPKPGFVRADVPDPPAGGAQWVSPTFTIPAGEERFTCMRLATTDETLYIQSSEVYQVAGGHHVIAFHTADLAGVDPAPHRCNGDEMRGNIRFATVGAADGTGLSMPEGVVLEIPAGAEIWAQSHYVNAGTEDLVAQDVVNVELIAEADVQQIAGTFAQSDFAFEIPPREQVTRTMQCQFRDTVTIPWLVPHMHEYGKEYDVRIMKGDEVVWSKSGAWTSALRNDFLIEEFDEHITVTAEHSIQTTCTWNNPGDGLLEFPEEMCVTFFPFYPGNGELVLCNQDGLLSGAGPGPSSGFTDACVNAADRSILDDPTTPDAIAACGFSCLSGGACQCLRDLGLSEECSTCHGDNIACAAGACLGDCAGDSSSPACSACLDENCFPELEKCAGTP